jgi:hypothetical protein
MAKIPTSVILRRRAQSYLITDPNTPLITAWANMVLRATSAKDDVGYETELRAEQPWFCDPDNNWSQPDAVEFEYALVLAAKAMGVSPDEIQNLEDAINQCRRLEGPGVALPPARKYKITSVVGKNIVFT